MITIPGARQGDERRPSVPLPSSWRVWIVGAIVLIVLFEYAPKIAGWVLLAIVGGFVLVGPGSKFFGGGGNIPQIGGTFP